MEVLVEYGVFLLKTLTILIAFLLAIVGAVAITRGDKDKGSGNLKIRSLNNVYDDYQSALEERLLDKKALKAKRKALKKTSKETSDATLKGRLFVIDFLGDIRASAVEHFKEEITAILTIASKETDEVLCRLQSGGGMVHAYGLAASQLMRVKKQGIPLTVAVDKVAASGGYMMAAVADKIIAAPFAVVGSIGVLAQIPNFNRLLKENHIDFEQLSAGEFKRTLTFFGENTEEGRVKLQSELETTHTLFKAYIHQHRPQLDIEKVATGEHWYGTEAKDHGLVDEIGTSDDYLLSKKDEADLYTIAFQEKKSLGDRFSGLLQKASFGFADAWLQKDREDRILH